MSDLKTYEIAGKTYEQRPLVYGQLLQLVTMMQENDCATPPDLLQVNVPLVLAVVLTEQGKNPRDKDLSALAVELSYAMPVEQIAEVVRDFFVNGRIGEQMQALAGLAQEAAIFAAPSKSSSPSSAAATGPSATPSAGDSDPQPPAPGSPSEAATDSCASRS
jgi:hypothetical protein